MQQTEALVTATYSRRMRLHLANGDRVDARIKGKTLKPVCGDRVLAEPIENESDWLITNILDRDNELNRPNLRGDVEILAANIELLVVVAAASPKPDWFIVDRYLCAAEDMGIRSAVLFNKTDVSDADSSLGDYQVIGYDTIQCSAKSGHTRTNDEDFWSGIDSQCLQRFCQEAFGNSRTHESDPLFGSILHFMLVYP